MGAACRGRHRLMIPTRAEFPGLACKHGPTLGATWPSVLFAPQTNVAIALGFIASKRHVIVLGRRVGQAL